LAKIYSFKAGARIPDDVVAAAKKDEVKTSLVSAIGGVRELKLGYFNQKTKKYEEHDYREELEVTSLLGNITIKEGEPFLHVHGTFGRRDMSVIGGHVVSATVSPLLELVVTPTKNRGVRRFDEAIGLFAIR
jgi:uncharacterized protein